MPTLQPPVNPDFIVTNKTKLVPKNRPAMVKAYLRYEPERTFGVICSASSNALFSKSGDLFICAALEDILVWNIKKGHIIHTLRLTRDLEAVQVSPPQVTRLELSPDGASICAGYSDGSIRFWDVNEQWECKTVLHGHKGAVSALRFSRCGAWLASGGNDTDVCVWDVIGERGVCKLKGHRGQVTDVVFVRDGKVLVSGSKDSFVRVWDLDTQHCCQTVVGQGKAEVWSLDVDPEGKRIVVGSVGKTLSVFEIQEIGDTGMSAMENLLVRLGGLERKESDRISLLRFDAEGNYLACQSSGKVIEIFRRQSDATAEHRARKRERRRRKKASQEGKSAEEPADTADEGILVSDLFDYWRSMRSKHKIGSFSFRPVKSKKKRSVIELGIAYRNNSFQLASFSEEDETKDGDGVKFRHSMESLGHRSGIRSLALSSDGSMLASVSEKDLKVWNSANGASLHTIPCGYGLASMFVPGDTYVVVGTKEGTLQIADLASSEVVEVVQAHSGPIWSLGALPEEDGFVSAGGKEVKFWKWKVQKTVEGKQQLAIVNYHTHPCEEDVLCLRISPDGRLLVIALLSCTIKVFFLDSLKLFLTLYGHRLPVLTMDISADNQLLASGSADKNIKIWGLDYGDCHKSIFAHNDSVTQVAFVHTSHYLFSVGKDKEVNYWDMDKFELLLKLSGHHAEVWCLALSKSGDCLFTASSDRSIRCWSRTEEPFFLEEEQEKRLESMFESELVEDKEEPQAGEPTTEPAGRKTVESVNAADSIIDALEIASHETRRITEHANQTATNFESNPLLRGMNPSAYVLRKVRDVKPGDLEIALMSLPFSDALSLLGYLCEWLEHGGSQVETVARVSTLLVRLHLPQLSTSTSARETLIHLQGLLRSVLKDMKDTMGFNLAGTRHVQSLLKRRKGISAADIMQPLRQKMRLSDEADG